MSFLVVVLAVALLVSLIWPKPVVYTLHVGNDAYRLEVADTAAQQSQGLGGRSHMDARRGMLFIYSNNTADRCFWMQGMQFALDIIWTDDAKKVVHIAHSVEPGSYPKKFCPGSPARYVIELNAGQAARSGVHQGQQLQF